MEAIRSWEGSAAVLFMSLIAILGGIAVSLTSSAVYIIGGILVVNYMGYEDWIPAHILPWFFGYMILAIIMFGAMSAAMDSTCSEPKDAQSMSFPVMIPMLIPMFVYFPIVKEPLSSFATWMSLIPPFTPMLMLARIVVSDPPAWEIAASIAVLILSTYLVTLFSARVFRVGILMYGKRPNLGEIIRWSRYA